MCSHFLKKMENYHHQGDLADIVRPTAAAVDGATAPAAWQFPSNTIQYSPDPVDDFGDPFTYTMRDPLMQNDVVDSSASGLFFNAAGNNSSMFSRVLQISPSAKLAPPPCVSVAPPRGGPPVPILVHNNTIQISSPRNTGVKRRKSQAKKVVCIPAPAPANSRATGEIVPSDLWAWRKYGQKPIKGSPYPRGYYRCSSSKGCPARKQVERSRTDPNMLVITYTSDHNHPWPTQRNALAGSTRSQPSKNTKTSSPPNSHTQKPTNSKHDQQNGDSALVKEETTDQDFENQLEMEETEQFDDGLPNTATSYKPAYNSSEDSFFAELGEIEGDCLSGLLFTQGFSRDDPGRVSDGLDPFSFYDWAGGGGGTTGESNGAGLLK